MNRISCRECKQCNRKGKPSVSRFSAYCDSHYIKHQHQPTKFSIFTSIKNKILEKRAKYDKDGKLIDLDKRGFRESWFWR